jgi:excisionase family DNA binding protein
MPQPSARETLTTSAAAQLLRVSPSTLKRWAAAGLIRSERTSGGHRRFRRSDLEVFVSAPGPAGDEPSRWANALLGSEEALQLRSRLFGMRVRLESWWAVAERLMPALFEMQRRRDVGEITAVHFQCGIDRLNRAAGCAVAHVPRHSDAPVALLACVPHDRLNVTLAPLELCMAEQGWRTRGAGPASSQEIAEELERRRPDALVVGACLRSDADVVEQQARELPPIAEMAGVPLAFVGLGEWPDPAAGAFRLRGFSDARAWLEQVTIAGREARA